jgi:uncharacterized membrane protein YccC
MPRSLVLAGLTLVFGDDGTEAMAFTALALWCCFAAWFVHHLAPDGADRRDSPASGDRG